MGILLKLTILLLTIMSGRHVLLNEEGNKEVEQWTYSDGAQIADRKKFDDDMNTCKKNIDSHLGKDLTADILLHNRWCRDEDESICFYQFEKIKETLCEEQINRIRYRRYK